MLAASLPRTGFLSLVLFLIACGLVVLQAYFFNWKLDDAYITFSYARNWVEGHGIVFNVGERVEGYTCFLWVALSALGLLLGAPIEAWSTILGVAFALITLAATAGLARELLLP